MSFVPGIPASGQSLGSSRPSVLSNFSTLRTTNAVNHVDVNDTGAGKHKFMQMPEQASSPGTSANETALYTKDAAGASEVFFQRESIAAAGTDIQMTGPGSPVVAGTGRTFLPGGVLLQWGVLTNFTSGSAFTFIGVGAISFANNCFNMTITSRDKGNSAAFFSVNGLSKTGATSIYVGGTAASPFNGYWVAIGN